MGKALKQDIPLRQRDDWEEYLDEQRQRHVQLTAAIVTHEQGLNKL